MPLGITRLNARKTQPNPHINFIKPLAGPDSQTSQDFLERIAAQCLPVMRSHHLYVMSLEEFPTNREFVGRNFNAGEVIQLVLKAPGGRWLPLQYVQMVMMHELAHCKQMNHSRAFWAVRNGYAEDMRGLWARGYTGDGIWGRGAALSTGRWERDTVVDGDALPEHLCGGTYRSRGRKRKSRPTLSYQERKTRRIQNKFGTNGVPLGADDQAKLKLEKGKKVQGKPRVAGSARGRELRAAAAMARFGQQQKEEEVTVKDEDDCSSDGESDYDEGDDDLVDSKDAVDFNGDRLVDAEGRSMIKVSEDEEAHDDPEARDELEELQGVFTGIKREPRQDSDSEVEIYSIPPTEVRISPEEHRQEEKHRPIITSPALPPPKQAPPTSRSGDDRSKGRGKGAAARGAAEQADTPDHATKDKNSSSSSDGDNKACPLCSYANAFAATTCSMCANVVDATAARNGWRCSRPSCRDAGYVNSRDCGVCGLCGRRSDAAAGGAERKKGA
ncbi:WLM domain [Geosmithia morbida]|uniref:WLM domain n=1 Tax=Geosmithia morbida TaxID=1094350 RepID=A0A9P5D437_9HYPO|nr:WLM domain [Geosmithia morbida]KAF4122420.1 WLM domain [Geosmithia morbida]